MKDIKIDYNPTNLSYVKFSELNKLCFKNEPILKNQFEQFLTSNFWIIYFQKALIGFSILTVSEKVAWIKRIGIHPHFRGNGFSALLMDSMFDYCRANKYSKICLMVQQDNLSALNLYKKYGFRITGESVRYKVDISKINNIKDDLKVLRITEFDKTELPEEVEKLRGKDNPPRDNLFLFVDKDKTLVGFCILNIAIPGCKPFKLFKDVKDLNTLLFPLKSYLLSHHNDLKILTDDYLLKEKLIEKGCKEEYKLYTMMCLV